MRSSRPSSAHRLRQRAYSPSSLQQFAVCPYRFFLSAVHRLAPREEAAATARLDPLTRGSLVHEVQAVVIRRLQAMGVFPIAGPSLPAALLALDRALGEVSERYRDDLAPPVDRVWDDDIERIRADLHGWLQRLSDRPDKWLPIHVELGFGFPPGMGRDPASLPQAATLPGGYRLHGIVDLVEQKAGASELRVVDHKTGRRVPDARRGRGWRRGAAASALRPGDRSRASVARSSSRGCHIAPPMRATSTGSSSWRRQPSTAIDVAASRCSRS